MREKIYYMLAIAVLLVAIAALVVVFGQNQPATSQQQPPSSLQSMFTTLAARVNQDAEFAFRVRVAATGNNNTVTVGKGGAKITDVGSDYFCLSNNPPSKVCYPFAQLLAVAL
jgi:hypothetical protein